MVSFLHNDLTSLYKLIERLLYLSEDKETQIIAGKLPEIFPNEIPFPSDATIIGSVVHDDEWRNEWIEVFFDVSLQREQLNNFYQQNLGTNWNRKEDFGGGFTSVSHSLPQNLEHMYFVDRTQNRELNINVIDPRKESQQGIIMVSLLLEQRSNYELLPLAPLPILPSPPNTRILRATGGSSEKESSADAELKTNLDLQELITHYAACFERARWVENDNGEEKNFVWRNWKMTDENDRSWLGVLQITLLAETGHYLASARVS